MWRGKRYNTYWSLTCTLFYNSKKPFLRSIKLASFIKVFNAGQQNVKIFYQGIIASAILLWRKVRITGQLKITACWNNQCENNYNGCTFLSVKPCQVQSPPITNTSTDKEWEIVYLAWPQRDQNSYYLYFCVRTLLGLQRYIFQRYDTSIDTRATIRYITVRDKTSYQQLRPLLANNVFP